MVGVFDDNRLRFVVDVLDRVWSFGYRRQFVAGFLLVLTFNAEEDVVSFPNLFSLLPQALVEGSLIALLCVLQLGGRLSDGFDEPRLPFLSEGVGVVVFRRREVGGYRAGRLL